MDTKHYLSTAEVADRLGLSVSYLNQLRVRGGGPVFAKLGQRVVYDPADIASWLESNKHQSTSDKRLGAVWPARA